MKFVRGELKVKIVKIRQHSLRWSDAWATPSFTTVLWTTVINEHKQNNKQRSHFLKNLFQNPNVSQMKFALEFQRLKWVRKGWFPVSQVSRNFYLRTCVKFTLVYKIEVARKRTLNFSFKLSTFYLDSLLFRWSKFTCVNVRSQKRVSGNQLKFLFNAMKTTQQSCLDTERVS